MSRLSFGVCDLVLESVRTFVGGCSPVHACVRIVGNSGLASDTRIRLLMPLQDASWLDVMTVGSILLFAPLLVQYFVIACDKVCVREATCYTLMVV